MKASPSSNLNECFQILPLYSTKDFKCKQDSTVCQEDFSPPTKSIFPLSAVKSLLSSIPCNNGLKIKWNWKWKEQWKMTDLKGFYWNYGLLLRSESVSIIRFLAFPTNVRQLRDVFCVHVIKHALLLPSAVLQLLWFQHMKADGKSRRKCSSLILHSYFWKQSIFHKEWNSPFLKGHKRERLLW